MKAVLPNSPHGPALVTPARSGTLGVTIPLDERQPSRLTLSGGNVMRLTVAELREEQKKTLAMSPIKYGLLAKILFVVMDLFYGRKRSWNKFKVLEIIARVPYQAWEHVAFFYYHISWLLYVIKPSWSYHLNVEFEDHAEREYMLFAKEHPERPGRTRTGPARRGGRHGQGDQRGGIRSGPPRL